MKRKERHEVRQLVDRAPRDTRVLGPCVIQEGPGLSTRLLEEVVKSAPRSPPGRINIASHRKTMCNILTCFLRNLQKAPTTIRKRKRTSSWKMEVKLSIMQWHEHF